MNKKQTNEMDFKNLLNKAISSPVQPQKQDVAKKNADYKGKQTGSPKLANTSAKRSGKFQK